MDEDNYLDQYGDGNPGNDENCLTDDQLLALANLIGYTLMFFNGIESQLDKLIANIINNRSHQPGYAVIVELTPVFTKKVSIFRALYGASAEYFDNKELEELFPKVVERLYKIKDIRNEIAHANWIDANKDYEVRLRINSDEKGPYAVIKKITPHDLEQKIKELEAVSEMLGHFESFVL